MIERKYLPSKYFFIRLGVLVVVILALFGIVKLFHYIKTGKPSSAPQTLKVSDIVQKDANKNGIADWEEILWGLDPKGDGDANKEYINTRQAALNKASGTLPANEGGNTVSSAQNDALSAEFFALILSMQQSGTTSDESINSISDALGKTIAPVELPDIYTTGMQIIIQSPTKTQTTQYFKSLQTLLNAYAKKNVGQELTFILQGVQNKDPKATAIASEIGQSYQDFAKDLIKIPVPSTFSGAVLGIANDYSKIGQTVEGMSNILIDPIVAMRSLISYKKYNDMLSSEVKKLPTSL